MADPGARLRPMRSFRTLYTCRLACKTGQERTDLAILSTPASTLYSIDIMGGETDDYDRGSGIESEKLLEDQLYNAVLANDMSTLKALFSTGGANYKYASGPAFQRAAEVGNEVAVNLFLTVGKSFVLLESNEIGWTALHYAASWGHEAVVQTLVYAGLDVNAASDNGWTPLHTACEKGRSGTAAFLLEEGADVDAETSEQGTPLHYACANGYLETVRVLLDASASLSARSDEKAALDWAVLYGRVDIARELFTRGADVNAVDKNLWICLNAK